jgi:hypothetical protein
MPKYQVVLKETVLHTVFVNSDDSLDEIGDRAIERFNEGDLVDIDAEQLDIEATKVTPVEETNAGEKE